ncbi:hypothetical protein FRC12_013445 [Ceratobasidium sp. 428]|nr:hypothetical protein FRC12_013445 [Ceratobasidium sp. 428]
MYRSSIWAGNMGEQWVRAVSVGTGGNVETRTSQGGTCESLYSAQRTPGEARHDGAGEVGKGRMVRTFAELGTGKQVSITLIWHWAGSSDSTPARWAEAALAEANEGERVKDGGESRQADPGVRQPESSWRARIVWRQQRAGDTKGEWRGNWAEEVGRRLLGEQGRVDAERLIGNQLSVRMSYDLRIVPAVRIRTDQLRAYKLSSHPAPVTHAQVLDCPFDDRRRTLRYV